MDSLTNYWSAIRDNDEAFWHPQPSMVLRPKHLDANKKYPLLVVLHGGNDCYLRIVKRLAQLPDLLNIIIAVPAAVHRMSDFMNSWDDDTSSGEARISALIEEMKKNPNVDVSSISLLGFSQGSQMAYEYALDHPEQIQNVFAFAGFGPSQDPVYKMKNVAAHHVRFMAISGLTDAPEFLHSTHELQKHAIEQGISFEMKTESTLPHGLPLNLTEYFSSLWNESLSKDTISGPHRNSNHTR